jgi:glycosyltransferase involved in cell wall biosynthesis
VALFALNLLPQNVHILLVGDGPQSRALKAAVEADRLSNRVRFVGWVDNITPFFAAADIFVLPSRRESSTNVVLEAWAHKLPVVATTIPAPKAMLSSGENALLVSPDSEQELARAIERLIAEQGLANQLAAAGHKKVKAEFARDAVLEKYRKLYQTALARQRGA